MNASLPILPDATKCHCRIYCIELFSYYLMIINMKSIKDKYLLVFDTFHIYTH